MTILAVCGSLRSQSRNAVLLRALTRLAPDGMEIDLFNGLEAIPPFSPDREFDGLPGVEAFRARLRAADAVVISSPEYAHGVSGVLKNALDWVVGSGELSQKPVGVLNTSAQSHHAHDALCEILRTMDARLVPEATLTLDVARTRLDESALAAHPEIASALRRALAALGDEK